MIFSAPYLNNDNVVNVANPKSIPIPNFNSDGASNFFQKHGLAVKAVAIEVDDVSDAFNKALSGGGEQIQAPITIKDANGLGHIDFAEISLYGDVALRLVNTEKFSGRVLPNFKELVAKSDENNKCKNVGRLRFLSLIKNK
jgi:4-hydroxyphenylpyruvate dioxygenase